MLIYVIGTALAMLFAKYAMNAKTYPALKNSYRILAFLSFVPLTVIAALRYNVGTDYDYVYTPFFYSINSGGEKFNEVGFNIINQITYLISEKPFLMFAVVAVLTLLFMFLAFYEQSVNVCVSIYIFVVGLFYFNSLNQIRQALAMAIAVYAMKYLWKREPIKYFLLILLAISMHTSAVIYIPIYFIYGIRANVKAHIIFILCAIVAQPVLKGAIQFVISKTKYAWYLDSIFGQQGFSIITFAFILVTLLLLYYCQLAGKDTEDKQFDLMLNMFLFGVCFMLYSAIIPQADRLTNSMTIITPFIVPKALLRIKEKNRRLVMFFIFSFFFILKLLHDIYWQGWYDVIPYETFFSQI
ncbi:MAG: EpsG family protein [Lachnospiraceae bacterium]|nr:EpsG family protein [Lachnospiraceae bacterium]